MSYVEEPVRIIGYKTKQLRNREIPLVKVLWRNHLKEEATRKTEENMKQEYPYLFTGIEFEDEIYYKRGRNVTSLFSSITNMI